MESSGIVTGLGRKRPLDPVVPGRVVDDDLEDVMEAIEYQWNPV